MKLTNRQLTKLIRESLIEYIGSYENDLSNNLNNASTLNELQLSGKRAYPFEKDVTLDEQGKIKLSRYYFTSTPRGNSPSRMYKMIVSAGETIFDDVVYYVAFTTLREGEPDTRSRDAKFGEPQEGDDRYDDLSSLTGAMDFRVFDTLIAVIKDFIANPGEMLLTKSHDGPSVALNFKGTSDSRDSVYSKLIQRNLDSLPGVSFHINEWTGETMIEFIPNALLSESYKSWDITQRLFGDRFKDDYRDPIDPERVKTDFKPALYIGEYNKGDIVFILYRPRIKNIVRIKNYTEDPEIMAMVHVKPTRDKCIPITYEVSHAAVGTDMRKAKGYGSLIYGLVFQYMKDKNFGLTSDHSVTSSKAARDLWGRFADTKGFEKRKTQAGHDKFDYYGFTDDRDDDCDSGVVTGNMATDHSWMTTNDNYRSVFDELFNQNSEYFRSLKGLDRQSLSKVLVTNAFELFASQVGS